MHVCVYIESERGREGERERGEGGGEREGEREKKEGRRYGII